MLLKTWSPKLCWIASCWQIGVRVCIKVFGCDWLLFFRLAFGLVSADTPLANPLVSCHFSCLRWNFASTFAHLQPHCWLWVLLRRNSFVGDTDITACTQWKTSPQPARELQLRRTFGQWAAVSLKVFMFERIQADTWNPSDSTLQVGAVRATIVSIVWLLFCNVVSVHRHSCL